MVCSKERANNFHPYANYISLHIHPKYRLEAVEDKLIKALLHIIFKYLVGKINILHQHYIQEITFKKFVVHIKLG